MSSLIRSVVLSLALITLITPLARAEDVPKSWVDKDTGHRVWRLSDEPNSGGFYREEPNVRFSRDKSLVLFTSNMFGPSYVFGVEVKKSENPPAADVVSTPDLARKFNPVEPSPITTPK